MMIDYVTPQQRLAAADSLDAKRAAAWDYLNERKISCLHHGFVPTPACQTDVRRTIVRAMSDRISQDCARYASGHADLPTFLRWQAA